MTPFGQALRRLRAERGISQREMATALDVSPAYLSALEHGRRGRPSWAFTQRVIAFFNIIWDDAERLERLAAISDPRVVVDTRDLSVEATLFANRLARVIADLDAAGLDDLDAALDTALEKAGASLATRRGAR
ncbi:helix-turn-helix domain-containing protein [Pararhizobium mangrovi]|uniref:Helix-turn-helix transcriptional regulator n=1 Tax=Pararhizobium mangrovi TaxID=2590452 RepID=A0A506U196_9HYPH|nr:helix-turn-helix transcriptional regulator [Pararhizobium mangrovi]TPW27256.1 helix-turn-helix transcriptional regulator [Pararhizobium mangrovi]